MNFTKKVKIKFSQTEQSEPKQPTYGVPETTNGQYYIGGRWVYDYAGNPIYVFYTTGTVG